MYLVRQYQGGDWLQLLQFSADGMELWVGRAWPGSIERWDVASGSQLAMWRHQFCGIAVHPKPNRVILAQNSIDALEIWHIDTDSLVQTLNLPEGTRFCAADRMIYSPDGTWLATSEFWEEAVHLFEGEQAIGTLALGGTGWVLGWSPDSRLLLTYNNSNQLKVWDVASQQLLFTLDNYTPSAAFSPDGSMLAAADMDGVVHVFEVSP